MLNKYTKYSWHFSVFADHHLKQTPNTFETLFLVKTLVNIKMFASTAMRLSPSWNNFVRKVKNWLCNLWVEFEMGIEKFWNQYIPNRTYSSSDNTFHFCHCASHFLVITQCSCVTGWDRATVDRSEWTERRVQCRSLRAVLRWQYSSSVRYQRLHTCGSRAQRRLWA